MDNEKTSIFQEKEIVDTEKAHELVTHLSNMSCDEIGYAFEHMNIDGILNLNCIIAHALIVQIENAKEQLKKAKH